MSAEEKEEKNEIKEKKVESPEKTSWLKKNMLPLGILIFIGLLCVVGIFLGQGEQQLLATVTHKGVVLLEVDLSQVADGFIREVGTPEGEYNVIEVNSGRIRVSEATCSDQICVLQGYSTGDGRPIVCLPHELVITFEGGEDGLDAVTG